MSFKAAISAGRELHKTEADNTPKAFQGLISLSITFLSGLAFPILAVMRRGLGERLFLSTGRLAWALFVQWSFYWILKSIGFIWGIFHINGLYQFFVWIDIIMALHVLRILYEMIMDKPAYSYSAGKSWPVFNMFKKISWVGDYTIRLWIEPLFLFFTSLIVMRFFNGAIGAYIFISSFALFQLESIIMKQRRNYHLDHKDSEYIQQGQGQRSTMGRLPKPIPISHNFSS